MKSRMLRTHIDRDALRRFGLALLLGALIVTAALYVASVGMIAAGGWMMMGASGAGGSLVASSEEED